MTEEFDSLMKESNVLICNDFKPILMSLTNTTMQYCSYLRISVYKGAYTEVGWYKEKTNRIDTSLRSILGRFCDYCVVCGEEPIEKTTRDNAFLIILNDLERSWSDLKDLSIEINHRLKLNVMDYDTYHTDTKRKEALNNLLK
jgi:hypothetical protein